jgi:hypothetical protein
MGGLVNLAICVLAAVAFYGTGHPILFSLAVTGSLVALWSWGVMHNHATRSAKRRRELVVEMMRAEGQADEEIQKYDSSLINPDPADAKAIPDWLAMVNLLATLAGVVLLIWGAIVRIF